MALKRITIILLLGGTNKVRQFRLPRLLLVFFMLLFVSCALPDYSVAKTHKDLVRLLHRSLDSLNDEIAIGKQDRTELHKLPENQKIRLASTPSILPTRGRLSSRFGYRNSPFTGEKEFHKGIDIATKMNTPVVAPANGIVSSIRWEHMPGRVLYINHGHGLVTKYAHLQEVLVQKGQYVKRGETVALVGNTGRSTAPHLHYEVHLNGVPTDPLRYVSRDALSLLTDRPTKGPATSTLPQRSLQDEETDLEVLMRVDKNKKGRRVLFDLDKNEWQFQLPRWATVGSLLIVDLVIKNRKVIKWYPIRNLGYVASPTLSP